MKDIEIAQSTKMYNIKQIAESLNISEEDLEMYGKYKAKVSYKLIKKLKDKKDGKLVLVTAINPTPSGEGKTTVSIGLSDGLNKIGKKSCLALREPSLRTCIWFKRWCSWWWVCTSCSNGRYKSSFYRRYTCNDSC